MNIQPITFNNNPKTNFGHTFKVNICIAKPNKNGYEFVSPAKNTRLYKKLNSQIVEMLNENTLSNIRKTIDMPRQRKKHKTVNDLWQQKRLTTELANNDSDYKQLAIARSVYDRFGLGYIATGIDVPILEHIKGASKIGPAKSEALLLTGSSHTPLVNEIVNQYNSNATKYVRAEENLLRSKNNKEIMLKVNFFKTKHPHNGKEKYEINDFEFYEIKKSKEYTNNKNKDKKALYAEIIKTIHDKITQITKGKNTSINPEEIMQPDILSATPARKKKSKRIKNNPAQLTIPFKD